MTEQTASKVPQIRFKGFDGDWAEATVSDFVLSLDAGVSVNSGDRAANSAEFGILKTSAVTNGVFEAAENKVVFTESEQSRLKESVSGGTIIISRMNTPALVGANAYVESSHENLFLPDRLWAAKPRDGTSMRFLASILGSEKGRDALSKLAKGTSGSMKNITKPDVLAVLVTAPSPTEQIQIGKYFRELDRLIGLHQRKHDKLVTLKKAMLQKMFPQPGASTPEIRFKGFSGDWMAKKLGDCVLIQRGGSPRPIENFITQDANGINWVKIGDVKIGSRYITQTEEKIRPEGVFKSREVFKGDLILSNSMSFGRPYLMAIDGCIHDGWLLIRNDKNLFDLDYLLQLLSSETMTEQYRSLAAGGVVNNLNSALVQSTNISFPDKPEQQKIGTYFLTLDSLISKHAIQLQKLQQIKSACLGKMFV